MNHPGSGTSISPSGDLGHWYGLYAGFIKADSKVTKGKNVLDGINGDL